MIAAQVMLGHVQLMEQEIHKGGWNQGAFLAEFHELPDHLEASVSVENFASPPGETLMNMALMMSQRPELPRRIAVASPNLIALAFCHESWVLASDWAEDGTRRIDAHTRYGDTVGAKEIRSLAVVDIWGRMFHAYRERGSEPLGGDDELNISGGRINIALAQMLAMITPHLDEGDPLALLALRERMVPSPAVTGTPPTAHN